MKRIYIIRHAKSSWKHQVNDRCRPLKKRGVTDAKLVAEFTSTMFNTPDLLLCSPAKRTQQTAQLFIPQWHLGKIPFIVEEKLYDFTGQQLIHTIKQCDDTVNNLMIFAHNFAVTDFVNTFGTVAINSVPTCGFVVIDFKITSWSLLKKGNTIYTIFPKNLK